MKKTIVIIIFVCCLFSSIATAASWDYIGGNATTTYIDRASVIAKSEIVSVSCKGAFTSITEAQFQANPTLEPRSLKQSLILLRRGCCSWHGGVCGCRGGRAVCCDNTLSPSCGCN